MNTKQQIGIAISSKEMFHDDMKGLVYKYIPEYVEVYDECFVTLERLIYKISHKINMEV